MTDPKTGEKEEGYVYNWQTISPGIPTAISLMRASAFYYLPQLVAADLRFTFLCVAVAAAASDWLDGDIARRYNWTSKLGGFADLLGDKSLALTLMFLGWGVWGSVWWYLVPCAVIVAYHTTVMTLRCIGLMLPQSYRVAKIKFFVEVCGLILLFSSFSLTDYYPLEWWAWLDGIGLGALWVAVVLAVWSMLVHYKLLPDWPEKYYPRQS